MLADLLSESYEGDLEELWENERTATPSRVAVDETAVRINSELSCLYSTIDIEIKMILDVALFSRHGTDPAAAFLQKIREKHDFTRPEFLVDQFGYRTALSRVGLSGQGN